MKKNICVHATSPLGTFLALSLVVVFLVCGGLYLATAGGILNTLFTTFRAFFQTFQARKNLLQNLSDRLRQFERPQLITAYAVLILLGPLAVAVMGCAIRCYRFRILPGEKVVERQALWLFIPLGWLRWIRVPVKALFIPGGRKRLEFSRIRRMEIQSTSEGATVLVLTLKGERVWTISKGRTNRLQRMGGVISRVLGLERRDLVTWSRGEPQR